MAGKWRTRINDVFVVAVTVVGALLGVALGAYLNKKAAVSAAREVAQIQKKDDRDSRFWELRCEGYGVVLYKLGEAARYADLLDDGYNGPDANPHHFFETERRREYDAKTWEAWVECKSEFAKGHLYFSMPFVSAFERAESSLPHEHESLDPTESAARVAGCCRGAHSELLRKARVELGSNQEEESGAATPLRA